MVRKVEKVKKEATEKLAPPPVKYTYKIILDEFDGCVDVAKMEAKERGVPIEE